LLSLLAFCSRNAADWLNALLMQQDNVQTNTESVQCIPIAYSICLYKQIIWTKLMKRATAYSNSCSQVVLVYLHPFRCNSLLKCVLQPNIAEKLVESVFWGFKVIQGH